MKKLLFILTAFLAVSSLAASAQETGEDLDKVYAADLLKSGTPAPDFTLADLDGKEVSLSNFKGKTVVLVFWATWCPDCRKEVPVLRELASRSDAGKVVFLSVSFDRSLEALLSYARENDLPGIQLFDASGKKESAVGAAYHVKWIPSLYVIAPDGKVSLGTVMIDKVQKAVNEVNEI